MMIPKRIHYFWDGPEPSALVKKCMQSWVRHLPEFQVMHWSLANAPWDSPYLELAKRKKAWAYISDYVRLKCLQEYGGVYLDTDVEVVRNFSPLLKAGLFMGLESPNKINAAVMGSVPHHPFLECLLDELDQEAEQEGKIRPVPIPLKLTRVFHELYPTKADIPPDVHLHPQEYFYPFNPYAHQQALKQLMFADIKESTFAIHHWERSWGSDFLLDSMKQLLYGYVVSNKPLNNLRLLYRNLRRRGKDTRSQEAWAPSLS